MTIRKVSDLKLKNFKLDVLRKGRLSDSFAI